MVLHRLLTDICNRTKYLCKNTAELIANIERCKVSPAAVLSKCGIKESYMNGEHELLITTAEHLFKESERALATNLLWLVLALYYVTWNEEVHHVMAGSGISV